MRTTVAVMAVMALGLSGLMLGGAGFADAWGSPAPKTDLAQERLQNSSESVNPTNNPVSGPVSQADSSTVGLIADGLGSVVDLGAAVVALPITLTNLGFPAWFAYPLGSLAYVITGIGLIEFATSREWT